MRIAKELAKRWRNSSPDGYSVAFDVDLKFNQLFQVVTQHSSHVSPKTHASRCSNSCRSLALVIHGLAIKPVLQASYKRHAKANFSDNYRFFARTETQIDKQCLG